MHCRERPRKLCRAGALSRVTLGCTGGMLSSHPLSHSKLRPQLWPPAHPESRRLRPQLWPPAHPASSRLYSVNSKLSHSKLRSQP